MESPIMVPNRERTYNDVVTRVAGGTPQTISNSDAFDTVYKNHQNYYDDKRYFIFDKNFHKMENYLLDGFRNQLDSNLGLSNANLVHVDNYEKKKLNVDFSRVPRVIYIYRNIFYKFY
jgi:hypothetical protein